MYENAFNAIEKALRAEEGISNELDYVEQTSWVLFLKYLHDLESERRDRAELEGKDYAPIIDGRFRWDRWAAPKVNGQFDHNAAMTGDDLVRFVDQDLFPHLALFHDRATGPDTIEYKIAEVFTELRSKFRSGYLNFSDLTEFVTGLTVPKLNQGRMREIPIPLPPLDEQKRIVAVLDEAFEGLSRARTNAEANLADARELFRRCLEVDFAKLADTQPRLTIGEVATIKGGKRLPKGDKLVPTKTPFPYISIKDFNDFGSVDVASIDYLLPKAREAIKNYIIRSEDLYISIAGTIGKTGIVPAELDGANLTENAARMVFKDCVNNEYVYYFTLTDDFQNQAGLNTRTAAQPKLALERLKTISLPVALPATQIEMAERFRSIREQSRAAETHYRTKIQTIDNLRQSLLQKAFSGDLT